MAEVLPIVLGIIIGGLFGSLRRGVRLAVTVTAALAAAVTATVVSGEYRTSWLFVLTDVAFVVLAAVAAHVVASRVIHPDRRVAWGVRRN